MWHKLLYKTEEAEESGGPGAGAGIGRRWVPTLRPNPRREENVGCKVRKSEGRGREAFERYFTSQAV